MLRMESKSALRPIPYKLAFLRAIRWCASGAPCLGRAAGSTFGYKIESGCRKSCFFSCFYPVYIVIFVVNSPIEPLPTGKSKARLKQHILLVCTNYTQSANSRPLLPPHNCNPIITERDFLHPRAVVFVPLALYLSIRTVAEQIRQRYKWRVSAQPELYRCRKGVRAAEIRFCTPEKGNPRVPLNGIRPRPKSPLTLPNKKVIRA